MLPKKHYVIVRDDLPLGVLTAMVVHAAGITGGEGTLLAHAVVLSVPDEATLLEFAQSYMRIDTPMHLVREPDAPWCGAAMAIGIPPTVAPESHVHITRNLPLLCEKPSPESKS